MAAGETSSKATPTLVGNAYPRVNGRTNGAESRHVLKGHERGEGTAAVQQFLG
jgi:hypothetical protein